jgi:hypothetical protein
LLSGTKSVADVSIGAATLFEMSPTKRLTLDLFSRKRSISISESDSDISVGGSRYHRKKPRKMDEVERLAEMERQRRQKEAEQKVSER